MSDNGADEFGLDFVKRAPRKPLEIDNAIENFGRANSFILYGPGWAQAGMAPFKYHKSTLGEGGIRAAAFLNHRSFMAPGRVDDTFLTVRDLSATILEIARAEHPGTAYKGREVAPLEGDSFLSLLTDEGFNLERPDKLFVWEHDGQVALVRDGWKFMRLQSPHGPSQAVPGWQLYNLVDDPGETRNLASEYPGRVVQFREDWERLSSSGEMIAYSE